MNIFELVLQALQSLWAWAVQFFSHLPAVLHRLVCELFREFLHLTWGIMAAIPVPAEFSAVSFPDPGPMAWAIVALGVPTAMGIIGAAFTIRMAMKLIPFIHA